MTIQQWIDKKLDERRTEGLCRELKTENNLIDFVSNDYLGMARSEELFDLIKKKTENITQKRNGASGSRLLGGNSAYIEQVEHLLSTIFKSESALIFNSGYSANTALLSAIAQRGDTILYDELSHASIKDGARMSLAKRFSFLHNDLYDLEKKIKHATGRIFIVVESIYSMDGDVCPLREISDLARKYDAAIIVDEAHSTGIMGEDGSGMAVSSNLHEQCLARIYTFGKAMGVHGACVAGSASLIKFLINFARPFIYTTSLPPHGIASIDAAFELLHEHTDLQHTLQEKISLFKSRITTNSSSAIQPIIVPGNANVKSLAIKLQYAGYDVRPVLSPTVREGTERLRIILHTYNSNSEIENLTQQLNNLI